MKNYVMKRLRTLLPVLFIISLVLFGLTKIMPQDPVLLMMDPHTRPDIYEASYEAKKEELGLNDSLPVQYFRFIQHALQGDFGYSSSYQMPVKNVIMKPLGHTIFLNFIVLFISFIVSLGIGIYCACHKGSRIDYFVQFSSIIGISIPAFILGIGMLYIFSLSLHIFPIGGMPDTSFIIDWVSYMFLPVLTLSLVSISGMVRYVRNAMVEALSEDYIIALKSRGIPNRRILYVHALKNAILPIMNIVLLEVPNMISGSIIVEIIFSWNGIGTVMMRALTMRDGHLLLTMNLLYALLYVASSFVMDVLSAYLDPRIKIEEHG